MRYILLSKDKPLLSFNLKGTLVDEIELLGDRQLLPEILKSGKEAALQHWLGPRGIDTTRTNARVLLNELRLDMTICKYVTHPEVNPNTPLIAFFNFTSEVYMLEHYDSFRYRFEDVELEDDETIIQNMQQVGLSEAYKKMLILDALVGNTDRHEFNFGVLKKVDTGEVVGFAPYFDHNLSLNAHLSNGDAIGLGLYNMCKRTVGAKQIAALLGDLSMQDILSLDQKVRTVLGTSLDLKFVINYFSKILEDIDSI